MASMDKWVYVSRDIAVTTAQEDTPVSLRIGPPVANGQFVAVRERSLRAWLCYGPTIQGVICMGYQKGYPLRLTKTLEKILDFAGFQPCCFRHSF
jgi:hypothetical protein